MLTKIKRIGTACQLPSQQDGAETVSSYHWDG
jgi:hypothetical protein